MAEYRAFDKAYEKNIAQESKHWGELLTKKDNYYSWLHSPLILQFINKRVTGESNTDWFTWIKNKYLSQITVDKALVLGCGFADWQGKLINEKICNSVDAIDISKDCIRKAKERARENHVSGINYILADVNKMNLAESSYDLILCVMSLHHFTELESVFFQINKSLTQNGYFLANDFVGPKHFQWQEKQLKLVNMILDIMPEKYKTRTNDGVIQNRIDKPLLDEFIKHSPFEAVRSSEIIDIAQLFLDVIEIRPYGGTILHLVLNYLIGNFDENNPSDIFLLRLLAMLEDREIDRKNIDSDFVVMVGRKKNPGQLLSIFNELQKLRIENNTLKIKIEKQQPIEKSEKLNDSLCFVDKLKTIGKSLPFARRFNRYFRLFLSKIASR